MKILLCHILLLLSVTVNLQYKVVTWNDILLEKGVEELHNILSKSDDNDERELMEDYILIKDDGSLIDNKYFDVYTTKEIKKNKLNNNILCDKKTLFRIFKLLKRDGFKFLKISIKETESRYFVFFETMWATKTKENEPYFKRYNTLALFVYKYEKDKKEFSLAETEIFRH